MGFNSEKIGERIGFVLMFLLSSFIITFILTFTGKIPQGWGYFHVALTFLSIALIGVLIKWGLK